MTGRELGKIKPKQLKEISGLVASRQNPHIIWLHNDGKRGDVYAIDLSGKLAAKLKCPDVAANPTGSVSRCCRAWSNQPLFW